jgi:pyruvate decarboxylase
VRKSIENAKLILYIGALKSDFNTGNFSYRIQRDRTIEVRERGSLIHSDLTVLRSQFHPDHTQVQFAVYHGIGMKRLLPKLTPRLQAAQEGMLAPVPRYTAPIPEEDSLTITHAWLWPRMGTFFKSKDVIVTETGTSCFAILDVPLPPKSMFLCQTLWGSVGWGIGSTLGAAIAARERGSGYGRTILFVGDGSA